MHCLLLNVIVYPDGTEKYILPGNEKDIEEFNRISSEYSRDFYL
jgi:hypothetical protein